MSRHGTVDRAPVAEADGRHLRREQNREAALDALVALFAEGVYQPSTADVAERAGISPRSLFRYFDDVEDLTRAAIERQLAAAFALLDLDVRPDDPTAAKVRHLVEVRCRLFDAIAPAARAARGYALRHQVVAAHLADGRDHLRRQVRRLFGPELEHAGTGALPLVDVLCSFETYELLRYDQRLSRTATVAALVRGVTALVAPA
jgi:AcrR family transcriptional regulator